MQPTIDDVDEVDPETEISIVPNFQCPWKLKLIHTNYNLQEYMIEVFFFHFLGTST